MRQFRWLLALLLLLTFALPVSAMKHDHGEMPVFKPIVIDPDKKSELQMQIDATPAGGILQLEDRVYRGAIQITKPITIRGVEGTQIYSLSTIFSIVDTQDVTLENVTLKADEVAIMAKNVKNLQLVNVQIPDMIGGVQIFDSEGIILRNVQIDGGKGHFSTKQNAVAIYDSANVTLENNTVWRVQDGFYLERVNGIHARGNDITESRYGFHMMYSDDSHFVENEVTHNLTGFMIMIAKNVELTQNTIDKQRTLNSLGIYLYDVENVLVHENQVTENTIAMDIQDARQLVIEHNHFATNGTVFQVKKSGTARITANDFSSNILTTRTDSDGVVLQRNTYDDYSGKDFDGDGIGDTPHITTNAFGQWMVRKPVYQYFMESPSVVTLNSLETEVVDDTKQIVMDEEPLMPKQMPLPALSIQPIQLVSSSLLLVGLLIVRRRWK